MVGFTRAETEDEMEKTHLLTLALHRRLLLKQVMTAGSLLAAPGILVAGSDPEKPASGKLTKTQAKYQAQPKGDQRCSGCLHFVAESNTCKLVQGEIAADAWCMLWAAGS